MTFRFRALSDESETFLRDYELRYDNSLLDFHDHICGDLGYDPAAMVSFFLSDIGWEKVREFTLTDMGSEDEQAAIPMEQMPLAHLITDTGDRLIYTFDIFGDRSLFLEMTGAYKVEQGVEYPRTLTSEGSAPDQFDNAAFSDDVDSIFEEAFSEFSCFEGDDNYDDI